ncbi:MAG: TlpA family protein disulfide reductase [Clostridia bacterium]|nr:TlpA family protein disulfide reductase [Clostridia bacterium]
MRDNKKAVLWALLLVILLVGAILLYGWMGKNYNGDTMVESETEQSQLAPDFTVYDGNGNPVKLSDFRGKPVVINFWASWCYYCKEEMPDFEDAAKTYPQVQFLMVNATDGIRETKKRAKAYVAEEGFTFPVVYDTKRDAVKSYRVTSFPTTYFIGADGTVVTGAGGMLDRATLEIGIGMILE